MVDDKTIVARQTKAYQAFIGQLGEDLKYFENVLDQRASFGEESKKELAFQLHRLKGSSAFFLCNATAEAAKKAEDFVKSMKTCEISPDLESLLKELSQSIQTLLGS